MLLKNSKQLCILSLVLWMFLSLISHTEANFCVSKGYFFCCVLSISLQPFLLGFGICTVVVSTYLLLTFSNCYLFFYEQSRRRFRETGRRKWEKYYVDTIIEKRERSDAKKYAL